MTSPVDFTATISVWYPKSLSFFLPCEPARALIDCRGFLFGLFYSFSGRFNLKNFLYPFDAFIYHGITIFQMIGKMSRYFLDNPLADNFSLLFIKITDFFRWKFSSVSLIEFSFLLRHELLERIFYR